MNLSGVIQILETLPEIKQVLFGAVQVGDDTMVEEYPTVYVAPFKEIALEEPIEISNHLQIVDQLFEVMIVSTYQQLHEAREAIINSLIGKVLMPPDVIVTSTCRLVEGMQVEATGTLVYWRDIFGIRRQRRVL